MNTRGSVVVTPLVILQSNRPIGYLAISPLVTTSAYGVCSPLLEEWANSLLVPPSGVGGQGVYASLCATYTPPTIMGSLHPVKGKQVLRTLDCFPLTT